MEKPSIPWQFCDCLWLFGMTSLVKGSSAVVNISKSAEVVVVVVVDFKLVGRGQHAGLSEERKLRSVGNGKWCEQCGETPSSFQQNGSCLRSSSLSW